MGSLIHLRGEASTRSVFVNGERLDPSDSLKVRNHSPDGFNWGYGGSGPSQLSLAVLLKTLDRDKAVENYQRFKSLIISGLPKDQDFEIVFDPRLLDL